MQDCTDCKRLNERPIQLNQNCYRDFRIDPNQIPFSNIFVDYAGPFMVDLSGRSIKVWLLIVTCLYTRAVSIKICRSADTEDFMRALQLHIFEHGIFEICLSDLGSQIQAGGKIIENFLDDPTTREFFEQYNMQVSKFDQFAKGNSALGSLVEVMVKMTKQLLYKSIRKMKLDYFDFDFIICKTVDLVNKRPIAMKDNFALLPSMNYHFA